MAKERKLLRAKKAIKPARKKVRSQNQKNLKATRLFRTKSLQRVVMVEKHGRTPIERRIHAERKASHSSFYAQEREICVWVARYRSPVDIGGEEWRRHRLQCQEQGLVLHQPWYPQ